MLIEKCKFWRKLKKKKYSISTTDNDTKKILAQIEDRTFQVVRNGYWITLLFESVPMDKMKENDFCLKVRDVRTSESFLLNLSHGNFEISLVQFCRELNDVPFETRL